MSNETFSREAMDFIQRLDAAAQSHMEWSHHVLRCAVLHTTPGDDVLADDAHCRCEFGLWFHQNQERFVDLDAVTATRLDEQHREMHDAGRSICMSILGGNAGNPELLRTYERTQRNVLTDLATLKTVCLEHSARMDVLTGLPLRYCLEDECNRHRAQAKRQGELTVAVMLDVDHFKRINDEHGHAIGDLALKHVASLLVDHGRAGELLFRYGGEEFLALIQAASRESAEQGAERLLQALRDNPLRLPNGQILSLRASAGLADASAGESVAQLLGRADQALYAAKAAGRNTLRWCGRS